MAAEINFQLNSSQEDGVNRDKDIIGKYESLTERLLEQAVNLLPGFKRARYSLSSGQIGEILSTDLKKYLDARPDEARIEVEEMSFGRRDRSLNIDLVYLLAQNEFTKTRFRFTFDKDEMRIHRYIVDSRYIETGYEGHGHLRIMPDSKCLHQLHGIFCEIRQDSLIEEKPIKLFGN